MRLRQLHAATTLGDLRFPPSNNLELLSGSREGRWSIQSTNNGGSASASRANTPMKSKSSITTRGAPRVRERPRPIHPGAFLAEGLAELGLSQAEFARAIGVSAMRISHVVKGSRPVTAELALLFGKAFGQSPQYWLNLQRQYDLELAETALEARLESIEPIARTKVPG